MVWLELHTMDAERYTPASLRSRKHRAVVGASSEVHDEGRPAVARVHDGDRHADACPANHMPRRKVEARSNAAACSACTITR